MAINSKPLIDAKIMEAAQTTQYTAVNCTAIIDKFTATNYSGANATISVYLVPSGGSPGTSNGTILTRQIGPNEAYTFPALTGQILKSGDYISTTGTATALSIRCSGREITGD